MSFIPRDLEDCNKKILKFLENDIYLTLKNAARYMNMQTYLSQRWFGDNSPFWIHKLRIKHDRLANLIKKQTIFIDRLTEEQGYYNTNAIAYKPPDGWQDYTSDEHYDAIMANPRYFVIRLGCRWFDSPMHSDLDHGLSKFQNLVHELSHLFMDTHDHSYGYSMCAIDAVYNSPITKTNAANWAFFASAYRMQKNPLANEFDESTHF